MRILGSYSISPQLFLHQKEETVINYHTPKNILLCSEPDLKAYIPMNQLRRMGKAVRIGTACSLILRDRITQDHQPDAIIIATANGGLEDCVKFLKQIVTFGDASLTPTNFVQSTPNAVAGNIGLSDRNHAFNITHVNNSFSFVDALRNAQLLIEKDETQQILIGSVEEVSDFNYNINELRDYYKKDSIYSLDLFNTSSDGTICGEGAFSMYVDGQKTQGPKIIGFGTLLNDNPNKINAWLTDLLEEHKINQDDVQQLMLGYSGDQRHDHFYDLVQDMIPSANTYGFKNLFGEFPTVIALALDYSIYLLKKGKPVQETEIRINHRNTNGITLIYNHYNGVEHSVILLKN